MRESSFPVMYPVMTPEKEYYEKLKKRLAANKKKANCTELFKKIRQLLDSY